MSKPAVDPEPDTERRRRLRAMQRAAVALLLAMAVLLVLAQTQAGRDPAWGYVAAFAEAAMIGALADWFAVVALFRHPLGLPIWHTAIVPRRKDDIARNLGQFVESHFVSTQAVLGHVRRFDPAGRAARWLAEPAHGETIGGWVLAVLQPLLQQVDDGPLRGEVRDRLRAALNTIDPMPFAAHWAQELMAERRHEQALDWALHKAVAWLESDAAQPSIAQVLDTVDHVLVSALSGRIASIVRAGALRLCRGALADPQHVLRSRFEGWVGQGAARLACDADWAARVRRFQHDLLHSERFDASVMALWDDLRAALLSDLRQPAPRFGLSISRLASAFGAALAADAAAVERLNDALCRAAEPVVVRNRGQVAAYIQAQIDMWSKDEMTLRIELAIGRDLQFIRINGTLVGGLVGLSLHALTVFFGQRMH